MNGGAGCRYGRRLSADSALLSQVSAKVLVPMFITNLVGRPLLSLDTRHIIVENRVSVQHFDGLSPTQNHSSAHRLENWLRPGRSPSRRRVSYTAAARRCAQAKQSGLALIGCRGMIRVPGWLFVGAKCPLRSMSRYCAEGRVPAIHATSSVAAA